MKKLTTLFTSLAVLYAAPALAAIDTTVTYKSSIGVMIFLGILALIVVAQLVPALILAVGFFKAMFAKTAAEMNRALHITK